MKESESGVVKAETDKTISSKREHKNHRNRQTYHNNIAYNKRELTKKRMIYSDVPKWQVVYPYEMHKS